MSSFAKPVKAMINNFLETSKLGGTRQRMELEHQPKTQRKMTTTKHSEYRRTVAGKQMTDDTKQDFSGRPSWNHTTQSRDTHHHRHRKFFMQVDARKDDRKFLQFLWNKDFNEPPKEFEYQRDIFCASDSPACAIYALQQAARDIAENYPDILEIMTTDFYMDDFVKSVGSTGEALQLYQRLIQVLGNYSFNLIFWCNNS